MVVWMRTMAPLEKKRGIHVRRFVLPFHKGLHSTTRDGSLMRNTGATRPS